MMSVGCIGNGLRTGATQIGEVLLPNAQHAPEACKIFHLTGTDSDIRFLQRVNEQFTRLQAHQSVVPPIAGVNSANHAELAEEAFEKALALLTALKNGAIKQSPIVLVALNKANELMGISLNHLERTLKDGSKIYTPLKENIRQDQTTGNRPPNHSAINWLVSLSPVKGVGKALIAVYESLLPASVKRVDTVAEISAYTPQAMPLYEKFGFQAKPHLLSEKPIPQTPKPDSELPTFGDSEFHGMPMSTTRNQFAAAAKKVRAEIRFKPTPQAPAVDLDQEAKLVEYSDQKPG